jgi:co-chaperonin GroES (HSP10)
MKQSKYLNAFKSTATLDSYELVGDAILVERLPPEEKKTKSGIILDTGMDHKQIGTIGADKPQFVHVLAVGKGFYNDVTGEDVPLSVNPGDIILIGTNSVKWFSLLEIANYEPYTIGLSRESEIQLRFKGPDSYEQYFEAINKNLESQMEGNR